MTEWMSTIDEIAEEEIHEPTRLRMLITALVASNWVTLQMILLYVTDLAPARSVILMSVFATILVFVAYFIFSQLPSIAQTIQRIGGLHD